MVAVQKKNVWEAGLRLLKWKRCGMIDSELKGGLETQHETDLEQCRHSH